MDRSCVTIPFPRRQCPIRQSTNRVHHCGDPLTRFSQGLVVAVNPTIADCLYVIHRSGIHLRPTRRARSTLPRLSAGRWYRVTDGTRAWPPGSSQNNQIHRIFLGELCLDPATTLRNAASVPQPPFSVAALAVSPACCPKTRFFVALEQVKGTDSALSALPHR
jgi:hypothetical protein